MSSGRTEYFIPPVSKQLCFRLSRFGGVQLCASPWTVTRQAPLSMGILQARLLEWVARSSSRGIYPNQGLNPCLFCLLQCQAGSLPLAVGVDYKYLGAIVMQVL